MTCGAAAALALCAGTAWAQAAVLPNCAGNTGKVIAAEKVVEPSVGTTAEAEVGQSMVSSARLVTRSVGLTLNRETKFTGTYAGASFVVTLPPGPLRWRNENQLARDSFEFKYDRDSGPRNGLGKPDLWVGLDDVNPKQLKATLIFGIPKRDFAVMDADFAIQKCVQMGADSYRRELLYSGVSKGAISIEYREFVDNLARPAFSQELKYDLAEGDEIGFRGARFKILKATNSTVQYMVVKPLD